MAASSGFQYGTSGAESASYRWIIDPIDGTKNYVRGVPIWATLLGLEHEGEMIVGVVSAPALGSRWWAGRSLGAYRNGEPIHCSKVATLDDAQISFAWDTTGRFEADAIGDKMMALAHRKFYRWEEIGSWDEVTAFEHPREPQPHKTT